MTRRTPVAALSAFIFVALAAAQTVAIAQQSPAPAGAGKGYALPIKDGRCAMWVSVDTGPEPGEETIWTGACKNGWAHGFGIQVFVRADKSRQRYVGHVRNGMWHGMGRVHEWDAEGRLLQVMEGVTQTDRSQGAATKLLVNHPLNANSLKYVRDEKAGREIGETYTRIQEFFKDGDSQLLCSRDGDCVAEAQKQGHTVPDLDLGEGMNRPLPFGGWEFEIRSGEQSERTGTKLQMGEPLSIGMCLEEAKVRKGSEPRLGALLFPSYSAWQAYLRSDQECNDLSAVLEGSQLTWKSQCQPASKSELVSITQQRSVGDKDMRSQMEVILTKGGKQTARVTKDVTARFVGACTDDMMKAGQLGF
jgi:hypothetical protein